MPAYEYPQSSTWPGLTAYPGVYDTGSVTPPVPTVLRTMVLGSGPQNPPLFPTYYDRRRT